MALTAENYSKGFLIDSELMAGVSEKDDKTGFVAFVLRPESGEYLGYREFADLGSALDAINCIPRDWAYERSGGCGGCEDGSCGQGSCSLTRGEACPVGKCPE